jgi:hypothetical protein
MSVYQPSYLFPDGDELDLSLNQNFSCQVNGSIIDSYELIIRNITTNAILFDSGVTLLNPVLYDKSTLNIYIPANLLIITGNIKYTITCFSAGVSAISREVPFYSNTNPALELLVPPIITTKSYTFTSVYSQLQGVPISSYQYILYDGNGNVIQTSDTFYNASLTYEFDGLISGNNYFIQCTVVNANNFTSYSGLINFAVNYGTFGLTTQVTTTVLNDQSAIAVNFGNAIQIIGNKIGNVSYVSNFLINGNYGLQLIDNNASVSFNIKIPSLFQYYMLFNPVGFVSGTIVSFDNGAYTLSYDGQKFIMQNAGAIAIGLPMVLNTGIYMIAIRSLDISIFQNSQLLQNLNYNYSIN